MLQIVASMTKHKKCEKTWQVSHYITSVGKFDICDKRWQV